MNKLEFVNELGVLADKLAFLLERYTESHDGYAGKTKDDDNPIIIGQISASIQNGELATVCIDIGSFDSEHRIKINRYPNTNTEWRIEDK